MKTNIDSLMMAYDAGVEDELSAKASGNSSSVSLYFRLSVVPQLPIIPPF